MAEVLTESSSFDANVVVPQPGDARTAASVKAPIQKLTNRTKWLQDTANNHDGLLSALRTVAAYNVGTGTSSGRVNLDEIYDNSPLGNFVLSANRITVPNPGTYRIDVAMTLANTDPDHRDQIGFYLFVESNVVFKSAQQADPDSDAGRANFSGLALIEITDPGTQRIYLVWDTNTTGAAQVISSATSWCGRMIIQQVA